jgi:hypothetical protein
VEEYARPDPQGYARWPGSRRSIWGATPMDDEDYANWLGERVFRCMADMTDEQRSMFLFHVGGEEPEMMARQLDEWVPGWRIRYAQP